MSLATREDGGGESLGRLYPRDPGGQGFSRISVPRPPEPRCPPREGLELLTTQMHRGSMETLPIPKDPTFVRWHTLNCFLQCPLTFSIDPKVPRPNRKDEK